MESIRRYASCVNGISPPPTCLTSSVCCMFGPSCLDQIQHKYDTRQQYERESGGAEANLELPKETSRALSGVVDALRMSTKCDPSPRIRAAALTQTIHVAVALEKDPAAAIRMTASRIFDVDTAVREKACTHLCALLDKYPEVALLLKPTIGVPARLPWADVALHVIAMIPSAPKKSFTDFSSYCEPHCPKPSAAVRTARRLLTLLLTKPELLGQDAKTPNPEVLAELRLSLFEMEQIRRHRLISPVELQSAAQEKRRLG
jgi:hypothetical protein